MKPAALFAILLSLLLLPGCGNSDRDKDINKNKDRPISEKQTPEKK